MIVTSWGGEWDGHLAGKGHATTHPTMYRTGPHPYTGKNYLALKVNSAELEKLCFTANEFTEVL